MSRAVSTRRRIRCDYLPSMLGATTSGPARVWLWFGREPVGGPRFPSRKPGLTRAQDLGPFGSRGEVEDLFIVNQRGYRVHPSANTLQMGAEFLETRASTCLLHL